MKNKYKILYFLLILLIIVLVGLIVSTYGRYVTNSINNFFLRSKEFYFNSDKLKEEMALYQVDNWSGTDDYTITVNMNSRKNNLEATSYNIDYTIYTEGTTNALYQVEKYSGTIPSSSHSDSFSIKVIPNAQFNIGDKVEVYIEANATTPYKKKLKAMFTLVVGKERLSYEITDSIQSPYMQLRLTNTLTYYTVKQAFGDYTPGKTIDYEKYMALSPENQNKCSSALVTLTFDPEEVLIDTTNKVVENAVSTTKQTINGKDYINSVTIKMDAISSEDIRFYKLDISQDYTYPNNSNNEPIIDISSE